MMRIVVACRGPPPPRTSILRGTLRGRRITFPVTLASGSYLELESAADCRVYDQRGKLLNRIRAVGDIPQLKAGQNEIAFHCEPPEGYGARAAVTVIVEGPPLEFPVGP